MRLRRFGAGRDEFEVAPDQGAFIQEVRHLVGCHSEVAAGQNREEPRPQGTHGLGPPHGGTPALEAREVGTALRNIQQVLLVVFTDDVHIHLAQHLVDLLVRDGQGVE